MMTFESIVQYNQERIKAIALAYQHSWPHERYVHKFHQLQADNYNCQPTVASIWHLYLHTKDSFRFLDE